MKAYSIEELDLQGRLKKHGKLKFSKPKTLSKLQYIIHLLLRNIIYKKASRGDFLCLNSKILEAVIGSRYVKPAKDTLIEIGVIEVKKNKKGKDSYRAGKESKKYRICQEFRESTGCCPSRAFERGCVL